MSTWKADDLHKLLQLAKGVAINHENNSKLPPSGEVMVETEGGKNRRKALAWLLCDDTIGVTDYGNIIAPRWHVAQTHASAPWRHIKTVDELKVLANTGGLRLDTLSDWLNEMSKSM